VGQGRRIQHRAPHPGARRNTGASGEPLFGLPEDWQAQYEEWLEQRRIVQNAFPGSAQPQGPRPSETEPGPTMDEARQAELRQMATEGVVLGEIAGFPVKVRAPDEGGATRTSSWDGRAIYIDGDPFGMAVSEVAGWLLAGAMRGRTPKQAQSAARQLRRLSRKAHAEAGRRFIKRRREDRG
jgi:hypothetical protein